MENQKPQSENQTKEKLTPYFEPCGWLFNGKFYESDVELRNRTMSEDNKPVQVYRKTYV